MMRSATGADQATWAPAGAGSAAAATIRAIATAAAARTRRVGRSRPRIPRNAKRTP